MSQFFQWKFRIKPTKVACNNYPPMGTDISLFDFVTGDNGGSMNAAELQALAQQDEHEVRAELARLYRSFTDQLMASMAALGAP